MGKAMSTASQVSFDPSAVGTVDHRAAYDDNRFTIIPRFTSEPGADCSLSYSIMLSMAPTRRTSEPG